MRVCCACGVAVTTSPRTHFYSSITKQTKALSILVIIIMCLAITSAAPREISSGQHQVARRFHRHQRLSARSAPTIQLKTDPTKPPWWSNPCSIIIKSDSLPPRRHGILRSIKLFKQQINEANRVYRSDIKKSLDELYENWRPKNKYHPSWLPKNQLQEFTDRTHGMSQRKIIMKNELPQLDIDLQTFGLTFDNLETLDIQSHSSSFDKEKRIGIIRDVKSQIRLLLCELETALNNTKIPIPKKIGRKSYNGTKDWEQSPDQTALLIQDASIFVTYERFISDWNKIILKIVKLSKTDVVNADGTTWKPDGTPEKNNGENKTLQNRRRRNRSREILARNVALSALARNDQRNSEGFENKRRRNRRRENKTQVLSPHH